MREGPYRDSLYLHEIQDHDIDNLKSLFVKMPVHRFSRPEDVRGFYKAVLEKTLETCGVRGWTDQKDLDRALKDAGVRLERRTNYSSEDDWRNGTYVYKNGEIVTFISEPRKVIERKHGGVLLIRGEEEWLVKTNGGV